ncbi:MAG: site-specific integrase [Oscillospiraceae bacterium]|nr:site-specific integrase [Oscillospiraceae bacterium]
MASIRVRNGSYQITVSCGYDIHGKKLLQTTTFVPDPTLSPKKREKAVQAFAQQFESRVKNGFSMDGRKITLKEFSDRWIKEYAKINLQPGTVTKYLEELNDKILPALGHLKLSDLKPHQVNAFFASLTQDGARKDGKPGGYSKGTILKTRNVLSSILRTATEWEIIDSNPCDKVRLQTKEADEKLKFFTPEQTAHFLAYIEEPYTIRVGGHRRTDDTGKPYIVGDYEITKTIPEQIRVLFNLAIYTGLRKGELLALQWNDIHFDADIIQVSKAVTLVDGKPICKTPKTKSSHRSVSIPHSLTERLWKLKQSQDEFQVQVKDFWQGENWIFTQENGKMMGYSTPYQALQDTITRYNQNKPTDEHLPHIPFHGLRHTSATLLIASQQDVKTVSKRLGHAQTSTTMNIYAHALQESDRKAADALASMLEKP